MGDETFERLHGFDAAAPILPALKAPAVEAGTIDDETADRWLAEQKRRSEEGRFFAAMTHFLARATRP